MYENLNGMLKKARAEKYAIPAIDITENHMIRTILDTAEAEGSPIILMALESDLVGKGMDYITSVVKGVSSRYRVPIALHLDHATDFELIKRAIQNGFSSVMYDGSVLPFEENVANTKKVVEYAHQYNVSVEAELGHVAGKELGGNEDEAEIQLTSPEEVKKFVELTNVDCLAVSIGTAHGIYESLPDLDIQRLEEINAISKVPLVLHGGSGTPEDQLQEAFKHGIAKINLFADLRIANRQGYEEALKENERIDCLPADLHRSISKVLGEAVKHKMHMTGSNAKY